MPSVYTHQFDNAVFKGAVSVNAGLFIDGEWVDPVDGETLDVFNPATGEHITKLPVGNAKDVDRAVVAARKAYKESWGLRVPGSERGRLLSKLADIVEEHMDEIAAIEALDAGKNFVYTKGIDITGVVSNLRYYAGWADKNHGKTIEVSEVKFAYTRHEPLGVCGLIVPWNFPLLITIWKVAPALATGNTVILKPSENTSFTALKLAEYVTAAGFPKGVFNVVTGLGSTAGQAIAEHPRIDKVSFTGSTLVGRKVMETAARSNLKKVTLELGGKSPAIIFDDADLEQAIKFSSMGIFHHAGQMCSAGSRIYVQEKIYDDFLKSFTGAAQFFKQSDVFDPEHNGDPLVSDGQLKRVLGFIESGKQEGAKVETGGTRAEGNGYYVQPTVFSNVTPDMKIAKEEIFGPVAVVVKFKTEEEVIELANDTEYGLAASVFTQNLNRAFRVAHAIEAGGIWINEPCLPEFRVPFGGFKQSGFGKEMGEHALQSYTNVKAVQANLGWRI